ncbi:hypothetical protein C8Q79DRAFT_324705 [Trametes meyenii]|nr:hypothetical protein C8Q79DRAFT_324705 [Trametes meyenii]
MKVYRGHQGPQTDVLRERLAAKNAPSSSRYTPWAARHLHEVRRMASTMTESGKIDIEARAPELRGLGTLQALSL